MDKEIRFNNHEEKTFADLNVLLNLCYNLINTREQDTANGLYHTKEEIAAYEKLRDNIKEFEDTDFFNDDEYETEE